MKENTERTSRKSNDNKDGIIFKPDCIFCEKSTIKCVKSGSTWKKDKLESFKHGGWEGIIEQAETKCDEKLATRIRGYDLVACRAKFHKLCRKAYMVKVGAGRSSNEETVEEQNELEFSHEYAFKCVHSVIKEEILNQQRIMKLMDLHDIYVKALKVRNL